MKREIKAEIVADSKNEYGQRITTFILTYPRFIHAELLTHRLFSRNAASSRAIPAKKMIEAIVNDPFVPVAWQKAHKGMQGTEYFEKPTEIAPRILSWKQGALQAVEKAKGMLNLGITKQLVNRILEPYQWYTCIVTCTELDNFFELRCPQYVVHKGDDPIKYKSWKDCAAEENMIDPNCSDFAKLQFNKGQGEIHISLLAEAMWDSFNESKPKQLKAGEWHIPFGDNLRERSKWTSFLIEHTKNRQLHTYPDGTGEVDMLAIKIATARCARISYNNFEGKDDYEADIKLYNRLLEEGHMSPMEHCAKSAENGNWYNNFKGFIQLRKEIE